jgi:lipopolysaccharide export system protein LptA
MRRCWIVCISLLLSAATAAAEPALLASAGSDQPVEITADRLEASDVAKTLVFIGHAEARQGDVTIRGDRLTIYYVSQSEGSEVDRIVAEGSVRIVQGDRVATGEKAEFFRQEERMVLTGSPQLKEGQNSVQGHEIVLFLKENRSVVKGGQDGRVNAVFQPKGEGVR